jgi:hypothetical protein
MRNDETHLPEELPAGYQQRRSFQRTLIYDASLDPQLVDRIWESPAHVVSGGNILQTKERCQVARIPFRDQELLFKHHNWGGVWKSLGKVRVVPKARRAFLQAFKLLKAGIRTPRPLALAEGTFGRVGITSSLLTEYIPGTPLYHLIRGGQIANDRMGPLTDQIVELCERLASLCCAHNDLKPENLIVDHEDRVWLIDLENTRSYPGEEALSYWFSRDLDRLLRRRTWRFHPAGESLLRKKLTRAERVARIWSHQRPMSRLQPAGAPAAHSDPVLAAMILCEHSATDIERCVASVRDIADEIVLVAIGEAEILPALLAMTGCRVVDARGLDLKTACAEAVGRVRSPWILALREQDQVSPDLALEMQILLESEPSSSGYQIRCRRILMNRVTKFGTARGEKPVRLFRRDVGSLVEKNSQLTAEVAGIVGRLNSKIMAFEGDCFRECLHRVERHAMMEIRVRPKPGWAPHWGKNALHAGGTFLRDYLLNLGILDGRVGLKSSLLRAWQAYFQLVASSKSIAGPPVPDREVGIQVLRLATPDAPGEPAEASVNEKRKDGGRTADPQAWRSGGSQRSAA